ncbi:hypothetical protein B566_EDAN010312 [Ephemera danica]|nr:hypothetical protein B566_EDAN010312 [Ephemera danica]
MKEATAIINSGDWVVVQRENFVKVHKVTLSAIAMLGRDCVELENLLEQPCWSTYYLEEKGKKGVRKFSLKKCDTLEFEEEVADSLVDDVADDSKTNRFIRDDGQSQKLSKEEIEGMQSDGASAKQIIGQLVENSVTFDQKSSYAQEKYVKKKQKKYKRVILVRPTCIRLILQALLGPSPDTSKLLGLRIDSLSQLIYMSGAQSGAGRSTFLVFESGSQGLVTAAMLERLGSDTEAHLIVLGPARGTNKAIAIQAMNFSPSQIGRVHHVSLAGFLSKVREEGLISDHQPSTELINSTPNLKEPSTDNSKPVNTTLEGSSTKNVSESVIGTPEDSKQPLTDNSIEPTISTPEGYDSKQPSIEKLSESVFGTPKESDSKQPSMESTGSSLEAEMVTDNSKVAENLKRPSMDNNQPTNPKRSLSAEDYELKFCMERLRHCKADCLLIVGKENPVEITEALLPLVSDSRPVVMFSQFREPLLEMYMKLKGMKNVTALRLSEPWLRKYQVLSERTHPEVMMSSSGGYLLTGLTVDPQNE